MSVGVRPQALVTGQRLPGGGIHAGPISATSKKSVQESCSRQLASTGHKRTIDALTWLFVVPGTRFELVRTFVQGGLRLHSHVRCVRFGPSDLVTSTAVVRPCPSDPPASDRYGQVLCRNRAGRDRLDEAWAPKERP